MPGDADALLLRHDRPAKGIVRPLDDIPPGDQLPVFSFLSRLWQYRDGLTYLSPAPLYHSAPQAAVNLAIRHGGTVIIMEKFDPEQYLRLVERYRVTHSPARSSTMFEPHAREMPDGGTAPATTCPRAFEVAVARRRALPRARSSSQMIDWWGPVLPRALTPRTEAVGFSALCITAEEWLAHPGTGRHARARASCHILGPESGEARPAG